MSFRSLVRESLFGQLVYSITGNRYLCYTEGVAASTEESCAYVISQHGQPTECNETLGEWWNRKGKFQTHISTTSLSTCEAALGNETESSYSPSDWTTTFQKDRANPHNWPTWKKVFVVSQIWYVSSPSRNYISQLTRYQSLYIHSLSRVLDCACQSTVGAAHLP